MEQGTPRDGAEEALRHAHAALIELDPGAAGAVDALLRKTQERRFDVAVVGEFKRGKSTFVNALLGARVLPTGVLPVTSVVTELVFADEPHLHVETADGEVDTDDVARLAGFVTEGANPSNRLGVRRVVLGYPSVFLRDGIVLYDTPGVGSVHDANTAATADLLPRVDAAFFLTSADPPISAAERLFLAEVADHADKLFFVVNKLDAIEPAEREAVLAFTASVLRDAIGRDVEVHGVSARAALEGADDGLRRLEEAFGCFLRDGRETSMTRSVVRKARTQVRRVEDLLLVEAEGLRLSSDERRARRVEIATIAEETERRRRRLSVLLHQDLAEVVATIERDLVSFRRNETDRLLREAEAIASAWRELRVEPAALDARVKELLRADVATWLAAEQRGVTELVREATDRFSDGATREAARAVDACARVMRLDLAEAPSFEELARSRGFTFSLFEAPTLLGSLVPDLTARLPGRIAASRARRAAEAAIPPLVDKHCGRLRHHLTEQLAETERSLSRRLETYLSSFASTIGEALDRATEMETTSSAEAAKRQASLDADRDRLGIVLAGLDRVVPALQTEGS
jgi:GTP-binding protein EngB required for normal cell division